RPGPAGVGSRGPGLLRDQPDRAGWQDAGAASRAAAGGRQLPRAGSAGLGWPPLHALTGPDPLPGSLGDFFAALEGPRKAGPSPRCFGCGPAPPDGLHVRSFRTTDGVVSPIVIPRRCEGPPGAGHGGIVAAYLDEVLGAAVARATGRPSVTG